MSAVLSEALLGGLVLPVAASAPLRQSALPLPLPPYARKPAATSLASTSLAARSAAVVRPIAAPPKPQAEQAVTPLALLGARDDVWRGRARLRRERGEPTGYAALDAVLPDGGWPRGALSEILHARDGVGEFALVLPMLAALTRRGERVVLVAPPYLPCAVALAQHGVVLEHLALIESDSRQNTLWAAEQCLRSGAVGAVMAWPGKADATQLRRLVLAAETGKSIGVVWRDVRAASESSPAALRLVAQREYAREQVRILRCRGLLAAPGHAVDLVA